MRTAPADRSVAIPSGARDPSSFGCASSYSHHVTAQPKSQFKRWFRRRRGRTARSSRTGPSATSSCSTTSSTSRSSPRRRTTSPSTSRSQASSSSRSSSAMLWFAWFNGSLYVELHGREDGRTRLLVFLQMGILALLAVFTGEAAGATGPQFALVYAVFLALMALALVLGPRARTASSARSSCGSPRSTSAAWSSRPSSSARRAFLPERPAARRLGGLPRRLDRRLHPGWRARQSAPGRGHPARPTRSSSGSACSRSSSSARSILGVVTGLSAAGRRRADDRDGLARAGHRLRVLVDLLRPRRPAPAARRAARSGRGCSATCRSSSRSSPPARRSSASSSTRTTRRRRRETALLLGGSVAIGPARADPHRALARGRRPPRVVYRPLGAGLAIGAAIALARRLARAGAVAPRRAARRDPHGAVVLRRRPDDPRRRLGRGALRGDLMSYDLYAWPVDRAMSADEARVEIGGRSNGWSFGLGHDKRLDPFVQAMERRSRGWGRRSPTCRWNSTSTGTGCSWRCPGRTWPD